MTSIKELKYEGEAVQVALTKEELDQIEQQKAVYDSLQLEVGKLAKYKLEIMFNGARSVHTPFPGILTWWESGSKLHGGGDSKLYMCPGKELAHNACEAVIPDRAVGFGKVVCPACGLLWRSEELYGEVFYRLPLGKWADVLEHWFLKLEMRADVRLKYARDDIRGAAFREQERQLGGEILAKARSEERRSTAVYPLINIVKDVGTGTSIRARMLAFLSA